MTNTGILELKVGRHIHKYVGLDALEAHKNPLETSPVAKKFRLVIEIEFAKTENADEVMFEVTNETGLFGFTQIKINGGTYTYGFNWRNHEKLYSVKNTMKLNLEALKESGAILNFSMYV